LTPDNRSLAIKPDIGTYNNRAWSRLNQRKYPEARADLMKVLAESPDHMNGNINVAHIDIAEGKYGPAADRLTRVLQRYPNNVEALEARAEAYEHLGNLSEATADRNAATVIRKLAPPGS
jgi:tetratricopeptide (TPR) repeat protein